MREGFEGRGRGLDVSVAMLKDRFVHCRPFDVRSHLDRATTVLAGQDVDVDQIAPGDLVKRLEYDIRRAITVGRLQAVANIPLRG